MVAISSPPTSANAASGEAASGARCSALRSTPSLRAKAASSRPVPRPAHSSIARPVRRAISNAAADVLPIPISPSRIALPGSDAAKRAPLAIASAHCAVVIAGPCKESALPAATLATTRPGRGVKSCRTPQSTTVSARPCCRARTATAAPPARKFSTICQVTSLGYADTPCAAMPWSAAKTIICGESSFGAGVPSASASCSANCSMRPSEPVGLVLLSSRC